MSGATSKAATASLEKRRAKQSQKGELSGETSDSDRSGTAGAASLDKRRKKKQDELAAETSESVLTEESTEQSESSARSSSKSGKVGKKKSLKKAATLSPEEEATAGELAKKLGLQTAYAKKLAKHLGDPDLQGKNLPPPQNAKDKKALQNLGFLGNDLSVEQLRELVKPTELVPNQAGGLRLNVEADLSAPRDAASAERAAPAELENKREKNIVGLDAGVDLDAVAGTDPGEHGKRSAKAKSVKKKSSKKKLDKEAGLETEDSAESGEEAKFSVIGGRKKDSKKAQLGKESDLDTGSDRDSGQRATKASLKGSKVNKRSKKLDKEQTLAAASSDEGKERAEKLGLQEATAGGRALPVDAAALAAEADEESENALAGTRAKRSKKDSQRLSREAKLSAERSSEPGEKASGTGLKSGKKQKKKDLGGDGDVSTERDSEPGETATQLSLRGSKKEKKKKLDAGADLSAEAEPELGETAGKSELRGSKKDKKKKLSATADLSGESDRAAGETAESSSLQTGKKSKRRSLGADKQLATTVERTDAERTLRKAGIDKGYAKKLAVALADPNLDTDLLPAPPPGVNAKKLEELGFGQGETVANMRVRVRETKKKLKLEKERQLALAREAGPTEHAVVGPDGATTVKVEKKQKLRAEQVVTATPERAEVESLLLQAGIGKKYAKKLARKLDDPDLDALPLPQDEKDLTVLDSLGFTGDKESGLTQMRGWVNAQAAAKRMKKKLPKDLGTSMQTKLEYGAAEKALLKAGLDTQNAKKIAEKITTSPELHAEENLANVADEKTLKLLATLGFDASETVGQTANWVQAQVREQKRQETALTAMTLERGIAEQALLSTGMTAKYAKKVAKQIANADLTAEEALEEADNEKDLQIMRHLGLFGDTETVGTMRGLLHQKLEAKYGVDESGNLKLSADVAIDFGTSEEAFAQAGFSLQTAKKLAKKVVEKELEQIEVLKQDMNAKELELMETLYGGFGGATELNEQMEGFVKRQVAMKQKRVSLDLSTMRVADVDFGNAEEILVLQGFQPVLAKKVARKIVNKSVGSEVQHLTEDFTAEEKQALADLGVAPDGNLTNEALEELKDKIEDELDANPAQYAPSARKSSRKSKEKGVEIDAEENKQRKSKAQVVVPPEEPRKMGQRPQGGPQKAEKPSAFMQMCCCCLLPPEQEEEDPYNAVDSSRARKSKKKARKEPANYEDQPEDAVPLLLEVEKTDEKTSAQAEDDFDYGPTAQLPSLTAQGVDDGISQVVMQAEAEQALVAVGFQLHQAKKLATKMADKAGNADEQLDEEARAAAANGGLLTAETMTMGGLTSKLMAVQSQCFIQSLSPTSFVNYSHQRDNNGATSMLQSAAMQSIQSGITSGAVPISDLTSTGFQDFDPNVVQREAGVSKKEAAKKRILEKNA
ncbi:unnamed protein product [Amoebophrya sp. A120]|nr:unnamed protein product [Amoebophrya sp. A120]|eukprot:GSA120T00021399001.1